MSDNSADTTPPLDAAARFILAAMFDSGPRDVAGIAMQLHDHPDRVGMAIAELEAAGLVVPQVDKITGVVDWRITELGRRAVAVAQYESEKAHAEWVRNRPAPPDPYSVPKRRRWWQREPRPAEGSYEYWQEQARRRQS